MRAARDGRLVRTAGLVTCRQRPSTAGGVLFVTLEDEDGFINVVVRPALLERQRAELLRPRPLVVFGHVERRSEVVHVIAGRVRDDSARLGELGVGGREFR